MAKTKRKTKRHATRRRHTRTRPDHMTRVIGDTAKLAITASAAVGIAGITVGALKK